MMRILLFSITNLSILLILGIFLCFSGLNNNIYNLLIMSGIFGFSSSLISLLLSKWIALQSVNGKVIKIPQNDLEKWLKITVEKQSKILNIKTPEIAIYKSRDINAFATGPQKNCALIAFSTSLLKNLKKSEKEAVIAHEMSHIYNGDMITMTLIQGTVNTFVIFFSKIIAKLLSEILGNTFNKNKEKSYFSSNDQTYSIISLILEGTLGIFANLITMWFSRNREFYADSGASKLVGISKMISALKCLKNNQEPNNPKEINTLCINGKTKSFFYLFMSHPTIKERINALEKKIYL